MPFTRAGYGRDVSRSILIADLDLRGGRDLTHERIAASLFTRGVPAVTALEDERVLVRVAVDAWGRLITTDDGGRLVPADPSPIIAALAEEWQADLRLERGSVVLAASARRRGSGDSSRVAPSVATPSRILVVGGIVPIDPERRRGLAAQLECSLSVVPAGDMHLVQTHGDAHMDWPPAQRPVVRLSLEGGALTVEVYSRIALDDEPPEGRWAMRGIPDLTASWRADWQGVLTGAGEIADVQRVLARADLSLSARRGPRDPQAALAEWGTDAAALDALRDHPNDDALLDAVVATLSLPRQTVQLLRGSITVDDLPGSQHIERTGIRRAVWEQTHPTRPSLWTRLVRRIRGDGARNDEGPGDRGRAGPS